MTTLNAKAWLSLAAVVVVMGLLLFSAAGTVRYWQGWAYLAIFASTSAVASVYLRRHGPALLPRRMRAGPTAETQLIMLFTSIGFVALLVVSALDVRFGWSAVPLDFAFQQPGLVLPSQSASPAPRDRQVAGDGVSSSTTRSR